MSDDFQVRTVRVELLRAGPAHNQLLSPLTPYLAVCDDAEAGVVNVPFEQHTFERRMRAMRHDDQSDDRGDRPALKDRLPELRELGTAMARLLGSVPRFPGSLGADPNGRDTLVRVSLTLSASELAGLPFELAKVPIGPDAWTESWLSVQSKVPVVITRRTRNVSISNLNWLETPRILFISAGADSGEVPYEQHLHALVKAVSPFALGEGYRPPKLKGPVDADGVNVRKTYGDMLTVLANATFDEVVRECSRTPYTHVHILAHGARDDSLGDSTFGLMLDPDDGVISGERLASALTGVVRGKLHRPQVVTLATCDSASSRDVVNPGASLAHTLHQAGIALVVASQVPLGFDASILFAETFYSGLLWGEHPWILMYRVRAALHGRLKPIDHDWASLVVYETLPTDMTDELERATFQQCKRALEVALNRNKPIASEDSPMMRTIERLVNTGNVYAMEARALRADARMIRARDSLGCAHDGSNLAQPTRDQLDGLYFCRSSMEEALADYEKAVTGFLVTPGQGLNAPFRAMLAQLSIRIVIGKPFEWGLWHVAKFWADVTVREATTAEPRSWAYACLCELWLLRMLDPQATNHRELMRQAGIAMQEMVQTKDRVEPLQGAASDWLLDRLQAYSNEWSWPELSEGSVPHSETPDETFSPKRDLSEVKRNAERLVPQLKRMLGYPQDDEFADPEVPAAGPIPAEPTPEASRKPRAGKTSAAAGPAQTSSVQPSDLPAHKPVAVASAASSPTQLLGSKPKPAAAVTPAPAPLASARPPTKAAAATAVTDSVFDVEMLQVEQGDSLWIEWGQRQGKRWRMLIDCGTEGSFKRALGPRIAALPADASARHIELFILSHIDGDHVGGGIPFLQQAKALGVTFGDIWFNGREHLERKNMLSGKDGDDFSKLLKRDGFTWNSWTKGRAIVRLDDQLPTLTLPDGMKLTLLSPVPDTLAQLAGTWDEDLAAPGTRRQLSGRVLERSEKLDELAGRDFQPDDSRPNGSSIAVLLEYRGKVALLGADAYASVLASALKMLRKPGEARLRLDLFKLPHHASRRNIDDSVMSQIDCENYLVSTNGAIFNHPDREALARVVTRSVRPAILWFNYPPSTKDVDYHGLWGRKDMQDRWKFQSRYPAQGQPGNRISLL